MCVFVCVCLCVCVCVCVCDYVCVCSLSLPCGYFSIAFLCRCSTAAFWCALALRGLSTLQMQDRKKKRKDYFCFGRLSAFLLNHCNTVQRALQHTAARCNRHCIRHCIRQDTAVHCNRHCIRHCNMHYTARHCIWCIRLCIRL